MAIKPDLTKSTCWFPLPILNNLPVPLGQDANAILNARSSGRCPSRCRLVISGQRQHSHRQVLVHFKPLVPLPGFILSSQRGRGHCTLESMPPPLQDKPKMLTVLCIIFVLLGLRVTAYAITGVSAGVNNVTGERPFRQEINVFAVSGAAWDLYILALRQFQQANQNDSLSYFQIAGTFSAAHKSLYHTRDSGVNSINLL